MARFGRLWRESAKGWVGWGLGRGGGGSAVLGGAARDEAEAEGTASAAEADGELFLIDGNSLAYRAFFALPESIATADGRPTNAIYGFASMMAKILIEHRPGAVIVAWDAGMSGREKEFPEYKAQRPSRPDLLSEQWPHLPPLAEAFGFENVGRGVRGRRRDRHPGGAGPRGEDPGDGRLGRPRRLPAGRGRGPGDDHLPGRDRHQDLRPRGGDRSLRSSARARPRPDRPQGGHVGQHPGGAGNRRQDGRPAPSAVRVARGGARQRRRDLGRETQGEPRRARRRRAGLEADRHPALRRRGAGRRQRGGSGQAGSQPPPRRRRGVRAAGGDEAARRGAHRGCARALRGPDAGRRGRGGSARRPSGRAGGDRGGGGDLGGQRWRDRGHGRGAGPDRAGRRPARPAAARP